MLASVLLGFQYASNAGVGTFYGFGMRCYSPVYSATRAIEPSMIIAVPPLVALLQL